MRLPLGLGEKGKSKTPSLRSPAFHLAVQCSVRNCVCPSVFVCLCASALACIRVRVRVFVCPCVRTRVGMCVPARGRCWSNHTAWRRGKGAPVASLCLWGWFAGGDSQLVLGVSCWHSASLH